MTNIKPHAGNPPAPFRFKHLGIRLSLLLLTCFCFVAFMASKKANTAASHRSAKSINPADMVHGDYYYFSDHGSAPDAIQFDYLDKSGIHIVSGIVPPQALFLASGTVITVFDAGDIREATSFEID